MVMSTKKVYNLDTIEILGNVSSDKENKAPPF